MCKRSSLIGLLHFLGLDQYVRSIKILDQTWLEWTGYQSQLSTSSVPIGPGQSGSDVSLGPTLSGF